MKPLAQQIWWIAAEELAKTAPHKQRTFRKVGRTGEYDFAGSELWHAVGFAVCEIRQSVEEWRE